MPGPALVEEDGQVEEEGGEAVIEEPQDEDAMEAFGEDEKGNEVRWCLGRLELSSAMLLHISTFA
jgi:hypothetical protein